MNPKFGYETIKQQIAVIPILTGAATIYGPAIDRRGFEGDAVFTIIRGAATGSPTEFTVDCLIQESDVQASGYTDVDAAADVDSGDDAIAQMDQDSDTSGIEVLRIKLENRKTFLRTKLVVTVTSGSSPKVPVAGVVSLSGAREFPVEQPTQDDTGVLASE
jgi:hypothetical protein